MLCKPFSFFIPVGLILILIQLNAEVVAQGQQVRRANFAATKGYRDRDGHHGTQSSRMLKDFAEPTPCESDADFINYFLQQDVENIENFLTFNGDGGAAVPELQCLVNEVRFRGDIQEYDLSDEVVDEEKIPRNMQRRRRRMF